MPYITQHAPEDSTRSVNPYVRESSREKPQKDRHTDDCPKHFSRRSEGCTFKIQFYLEVDFSHDANTSMGHGSNKQDR